VCRFRSHGYPRAHELFSISELPRPEARRTEAEASLRGERRHARVHPLRRARRADLPPQGARLVGQRARHPLREEQEAQAQDDGGRWRAPPLLPQAQLLEGVPLHRAPLESTADRQMDLD
jgi:hypothetical protein